LLSLPSSVKKLNISSNNLVEALVLPVGLKELNCANNKIKKLRLPVGLEKLSCENNELPLYPVPGESLVSYNMRLMTA
jgi:Leucine-rich repeat (LRR) protein